MRSVPVRYILNKRSIISAFTDDLTAIKKRQVWLKNVFALLIQNALTLTINFFVGIWLIRYLGANDFGIYSLAFSIVSLLLPVCSFGLSQIVVKELVQRRLSPASVLTNAFLIQFSISLVALLLLFLALVFIGGGTKVNIELITIFAIGLLLTPGDVLALSLEAQMKSHLNAIARFIAASGSAFFKVLLILFNFPLTWFAVPFVLDKAIKNLVASYHFRRFNFDESIEVSAPVAKSLVAEAWPLGLIAVLAMINVRIDQIMLGALSDTSEVGIYSASLRLIEPLYFIPTVICTVSFPSLVSSTLSEAKAGIQALLNGLFVIGLAIAACLVMTSSGLAELIFTPEYEGVANVLFWHACAVPFVFMGVVSARWYVLNDLQKIVFPRSVLTIILNAMLNYFLIPICGAEGAAIAFFATVSTTLFVFDFLRADTRQLLRQKLRAVLLIFIWKEALDFTRSKS